MIISLGSEPNDDISALAKDSGSFFASKEWQQHLQRSFHARSLYFHDPEIDDGLIVQVFQRGPFRVGYLNFPIGGTIRRSTPNMEVIDVLKGYLQQHSVHRLRVRKSAFCDDDDLLGKPIVEPETAVANVRQYNSQAIARVRRDLNRAERFGITIAESPIISASYLFDTYAETVNRYAGKLRYPRRYFNSLVDLHTTQKSVRILLAEKDKLPVGFLVLIIDEDTAYYLHGGVSADARKCGVSDVLIDRALYVSLDQGVSMFNLMTSPPNQLSLVKYKEKWGGESRPHKTYDFSVSYFWNQTLNAVEKAYYKTARFRNRIHY